MFYILDVTRVHLLHDEIEIKHNSRKNCSSIFSVIQIVYISHAYYYNC